MTGLPNLQDAFQRFLLTGDPEIETHVVGTQRVPIGTRLGIYGGAYGSRLIEVLQTSYPVLARLLGEADFQRLGAKYVRSHPSVFFTARYYGDGLADFLATDADYSSVPVLTELARWEWAMAAVFDAADAQPAGPGLFAGIAPAQWSQLHLGWAPSVHGLELEWNVPDLWKAVTGDLGRPEPVIHAKPVSWLLWRRELQIYFRALSEEEATVVAAARAGQSFGELCVLLCEHLEEQEASLRAAAFLRGWVESGLIVSAC